MLLHWSFLVNLRKIGLTDAESLHPELIDDAGADAYVLKPATREGLDAVLKRVFPIRASRDFRTATPNP